MVYGYGGGKRAGDYFYICSVGISDLLPPINNNFSVLYCLRLCGLCTGAKRYCVRDYLRWRLKFIKLAR